MLTEEDKWIGRYMFEMFQRTQDMSYLRCHEAATDAYKSLSNHFSPLEAVIEDLVHWED